MLEMLEMFLKIKEHLGVCTFSKFCCWAALWSYKNAAIGLPPAQGTFVFKGVQDVFFPLRQKGLMM